MQVDTGSCLPVPHLGTTTKPWNINKSAIKAVWDAQGRGYLDYGKFNKLRLGNFQQLDDRVDKAYYYKNWSLMFYADIQNAYNFKEDLPAYLVQQTDANGIPPTDPHDPSRYLLKLMDPSSGTVLPTKGIMVEFQRVLPLQIFALTCMI
jgi:hypothetical protein